MSACVCVCVCVGVHVCVSVGVHVCVCVSVCVTEMCSASTHQMLRSPGDNVRHQPHRNTDILLPKGGLQCYAVHELSRYSCCMRFLHFDKS